jgi:hypothetical protein
LLKNQRKYTPLATNGLDAIFFFDKSITTDKIESKKLTIRSVQVFDDLFKLSFFLKISPLSIFSPQTLKMKIEIRFYLCFIVYQTSVQKWH